MGIYSEKYRRSYESCLKKVQKPARYIGNEFGSVHKKWTDDILSFAFCFPDVYEVGMSHLGMKILYHMLNDREDTVCERVFAPWDDMEAVSYTHLDVYNRQAWNYISAGDLQNGTLLLSSIDVNTLDEKQLGYFSALCKLANYEPAQ